MKLPLEFKCGCFLIEITQPSLPSLRTEVKFRLCLKHSGNITKLIEDAGLEPKK